MSNDSKKKEKLCDILNIHKRHEVFLLASPEQKKKNISDQRIQASIVG